MSFKYFYLYSPITKHPFRFPCTFSLKLVKINLTWSYRSLYSLALTTMLDFISASVKTEWLQYVCVTLVDGNHCFYNTSECLHLSCLLYKHVAIDGFSSALGSQGRFSSRSRRKSRQARVRRPTPDHPEMAALNGRQVGSHAFIHAQCRGFAYLLGLEFGFTTVEMTFTVWTDWILSSKTGRFRCQELWVYLLTLLKLVSLWACFDIMIF